MDSFLDFYDDDKYVDDDTNHDDNEYDPDDDEYDDDYEQLREGVKKNNYFFSTLLLLRGPATPPPLVVPWTIKILGPYFDVAMDAIGPKRILHLKQTEKSERKTTENYLKPCILPFGP